MSQSRVRKRYLFTNLGAGLGYLGAVFGVALVLDDSDPVTALSVGLALLPGLFVLLMLRSVWVYLRDIDEAARHFLIKALVSALFVAMAVSGVWGLAELFLDGLPKLPVFFIFPLIMGTFGLFTSFGPARSMGCA